MADKRANLIITLKDEATAGLNKVTGGIDKLKAGFIAVTAAVAATVAIAVSFVKSAMEGEDAANKLNIALKNQGIYSAELSAEMLRYSSQLQKTSTFSDEAITRTQALLTTFGLAGVQMKSTTQAALDLATGLGVDLQTATMLLGKAFAGETGALSRYGIVIDQNLPKSQQFSEVIRQIGERFGGEAQAATQTFSGRLAVLGNQWDDIKETLGGAIIPMLETVVEKLYALTSGVEQLGGIFPAVFVTMLGVLQEFVLAFQTAVMGLPILGTALQLMGVDFDNLNLKMQEHIDKMLMMTAVGQQEGTKQLLNQQMVTRGMIENKKREKIELQKIEDKAKAEQEKRMAKEIDGIEKRRKWEEQQDAERMRNKEFVLNYISSLSTAKNKELAAVGKAAALAGAYIDTYAAANMALRSAPPPFNFALAAAVTAAGLANVAKIVGVKMASGGIVRARPGGIMANIGEGGSDEAVIPLDSPEAADRLGGIGKTQVIIQAGVVVADRMAVREFARMIDEELFRLGRRNEAVNT